MPRDKNGIWYPSLFPKQVEIYNDYHRYLLISGPRKSSKTIGVLHKVVRHMWETPYPFAMVGMFEKFLKTAKRGVWEDLMRFVLPEWLNSGIGMKFTTKDGSGRPGPRVDPITDDIFFRVTNYWGEEAELRLASLKSDDDVEAKVKSTRFSMLYFSELSNFKHRKVFVTSIPQLRMMHLDRQYHQWIADTNPSEEGPHSWIYKIFYEERTAKDHPKPNFQKDIGLIEVFWKDNPTFSQEDREEIESLCAHDPELFDRYARGLWTAGGLQERHFKDLFVQGKHVLGDVSSMNQENWEIISPSETCFELVVGWDTGDVNHAAIIFESVRNVEDGSFYFSILDECIWNHVQRPLEEFVWEVTEKMERLEKMLGRKVVWSHWSDESVIKHYRGSAGAFDAMVIYKASKERIMLQGVPKTPGSVQTRVQILKQLLSKDQVFISAQCTHTIDMFNNLRKGRTPAEYVPKFNNEHKHPFDALTYGLQMEMSRLLVESPEPEKGSGIIMDSH